MFKKLLELHSELNEEQFILLLNTCHDDISFHEGIGSTYTSEAIREIITTASIVVASATS